VTYPPWRRNPTGLTRPATATRDGLDGLELLSLSVAARRLGVSPSTVDRWVRDGHLAPASVLPSGHRRFRASDVDVLVAQAPARTGDGLLRTSEAAERLQISVRSVLSWAQAGKLPSITTPGGHRRYRASDVERVRARMWEEVEP
jgi:excisionase family DNA binding protein